jgi:hypothetical protein
MRKSIFLLGFFVLLLGCSSKIIQPAGTPWQSVPCQYRLEGDDLSVLLVRAQIAEFDSAKIVAHTLCWTILGDTLGTQTTLYPRAHEISQSYTIFTADRCLPINSVMRSVELFIK